MVNSRVSFHSISETRNEPISFSSPRSISSQPERASIIGSPAGFRIAVVGEVHIIAGFVELAGGGDRFALAERDRRGERFPLRVFAEPVDDVLFTRRRSDLERNELAALE